MQGMKQSILLFAVLLFLVGCGVKLEAVEPQAQSTATLQEAENPWETPTRLALFMSQKIENANDKASALNAIVSALAEAGEIKRALEVAQKIEDVGWKALASSIIALFIATESIPKNKKDKPDRPVTRRMKKAFTPKEKQMAKQLVEAAQGN